MSMKPTVLWAQRPDSVFVTIDIKEVSDETIDITETSFSFKGTSNGKLWQTEFELNAPIKKDEVKISKNRVIEIFLPKVEEESWSSLTKTKQANVKVDWSKWADSDDEGEGFDTAGMGGMPPGGMGGMGGGMPGMGGMGGMPGMGGPPGAGGMDFSSLLQGMGGAGGGGPGGMDMAAMMQQMQGEGGGMGGGDSDDEDGELPDLDEPVKGAAGAAGEEEVEEIQGA